MMISRVAPVLGLAAVALAFPQVTSLPTSDCSTKTVCADYVNDCGKWYGGCFSACTPWPTFTAPPCPSTTSTITSPPTTTATSDPCTGTVCTDYFKTCGTTAILTYGGCFPACAPVPTFSPPPCPTGTSTSPVTVTSSSAICSSTGTVCTDIIETCGTTAELTYGGCYEACGPTPVFLPPPCPTPTTTSR